ncbi:MAG: 30S ribosomal protein S17 [Candidatus Andersenbacteria bacterium]|nr:30S ribosomal protein S17 [bacterium]MDZ4225632.1 30S ribosomal protein S17 [Candidatus Andersenbacteria bacterium]
MSKQAETKQEPVSSGRRQTLTGVVTKKSGDKTVAVQVETVEVHSMYQKRRLRSKIYLAHDEQNECQAGDKVMIRESRPLSARKRWVVVKRDKPSLR